MHDAVDADEYEERCQGCEHRDRPGTRGIRTAAGLQRHSWSPAHSRDLRSRFSRVQCPISPAILLFPRDWSTISAPGVAWSAFCAPGTCSVQLPAERLRSSPCVRTARTARHRPGADGTVAERDTPVERHGTHRYGGSRSRTRRSRRENYVRNERVRARERERERGEKRERETERHREKESERKRESDTPVNVREDPRRDLAPLLPRLVLVSLSRAVDCCLETLGVRSTLVPPPPPSPGAQAPGLRVPSRDSPPINFLRAPSNTLSFSLSHTLTLSISFPLFSPLRCAARTRNGLAALAPS